jgi:hypothetical protein
MFRYREELLEEQDLVTRLNYLGRRGWFLREMERRMIKPPEYENAPSDHPLAELLGMPVVRMNAPPVVGFWCLLMKRRHPEYESGEAWKRGKPA